MIGPDLVGPDDVMSLKYWSSADYDILLIISSCLTHFQLELFFRSTKAFMVKRLEAEGAEVVFLFLTGLAAGCIVKCPQHV